MTENHSVNDDCCPYHLFLRDLYKCILDTEVTPPEIICGIAFIAAAITIASNKTTAVPLEVLQDSFCKIYRDSVQKDFPTIPTSVSN